MSIIERQPSKREIVENALRQIWDEKGELTAVDVREEARPEDSPLHAMLEWNDAIASENFRLMQAAALIRSVKLRITSIDASGTIVDYSVRQWQPARFTDGDTGRYLPVEQVRQDPKAREALIRQMLRDAQAFERRYRHLDEFAKVVQGLLEGDAEESA